MSIAINQCNFAGYLTRDAEVVEGAEEKKSPSQPTPNTSSGPNCSGM